MNSVRGSVTVMKQYDQSNVGRKEFTWLLLPHHYSLLKEVRTGTLTGQEPGGRSGCRGHGGVLLTDLLTMPSSTSFLVVPGTTSSGRAPPTMNWALPHQSLMKKKYPTGLPAAQSYGDRFFTPSFGSCVKLYQIDIKPVL